MKYVYPAVFTPEDSGQFSVNFPDLESCYTCGDDLDDAMEMAKECLALQLKGLRQDGDDFPMPSPLDKVDPAAYVNDLGDSVPSIRHSVPSIRHSVPSIRHIGVDLNDYN